MRAVRVALVVGIALVAVAVAITLTGSPVEVARTTKPPGKADEAIAGAQHDASYCQAGEVLPRGTSAIRVWLDAVTGPRTTIAVAAGGRWLLRATRGSGWLGGSVTVPVRPLPRAVSGATVCISFPLRDETAYLQGETTPAATAAVRSDGQRLSGRFWVEYLRPSERSWASLAPAVIHRMGLGRAGPGDLIAYLALALLLALVILTARVLLEEMP